MAKEDSTQKKGAKSTVKRQNVKKNEKKEIKNKEVKVEEVKETKVVKKEEQKTIPVLKKVEKKDKGNLLEKIDDNRKMIITGVVCFLLATLLFRCILWPDRIATLKDGTQPVATIDGTVITADELYEDMKEVYSVNYLLNRIDKIVLDKIYPDNDELKDEVKQLAENYYSMYESYYGYTKEEFLSANGFKDEQAFIDYLKLDKKRTDYYDEYVEGLISEKEVEKYYKNEVYGDVDTKHILVNVDSYSEDGLTEEEAEKMAKEIIKKLDKGTSWEDIIKEYKDNITDEELGYQAFNASLESNYLDEMRNLKVGTYSKTPVKTSYGYHIVFKIAQKEKPELDEVKDDIIDILATELKNNDSDDNKLYTEALSKMREKYKLEFADSKFAEEYKDSLK